MPPRVVLVGLGRTGGALALGLKAAGWKPAVVTTSPARAKQLKLRLATPRDRQRAELCIFAVPDAQVGVVAADVLPDLGPETALVHCAGALGLGVFGQPKRRCGSFHPLVAISDANDALGGRFAAIAANDPELLRTLMEVAQALKMLVLEVDEKKRARYHAGAVMSAGLVMALLDAAVEATGLPRSIAEPALLALTESAIRGAKTRGVQASLTGPIVRGDAEVVNRHLEALPEALRPLYRALSRRALVLSGRPALDGVDLGS
ncbi:MAG: DUF2520 domain-containing protein [Myxococcaceae bacterium]|nr:DUF2520 domain-containing protein [Myxococcaceae bacterium]